MATAPRRPHSPAGTKHRGPRSALLPARRADSGRAPAPPRASGHRAAPEPGGPGRGGAGAGAGAGRARAGSPLTAAPGTQGLGAQRTCGTPRPLPCPTAGPGPGQRIRSPRDGNARCNSSPGGSLRSDKLIKPGKNNTTPALTLHTGKDPSMFQIFIRKTRHVNGSVTTLLDSH